MRTSVKGLLLGLLLALGACSSDPGIPVVTVTGEPVALLGVPTYYRATTTNGNDDLYAWETDNPVVATIDLNGMLIGHASGQTIVKAVGTSTAAAGTLQIQVLVDPNEALPNFEAWVNSPHNDRESEAFTHWDDAGQIPASCAKCHSTPGYRDFLGDDGTEEGVVNNPAPTGTTVECNACHNQKAALKTSVEFPSGVVIDGLGAEANCMECHQGRESTDSVNQAIADAALANDDEVLPDQGFINVHYFPAAATRWGGQVRGGYMYEAQGKIYDILFRHVPGLERCQDCHDPHSNQVRLSVCSACHNASTLDDLHDIRMISSKNRDYDGDGDTDEGIYFEIDTLRDRLLQGIRNYANEVLGMPVCYDAGAYPYWFNDTNNNGVCDPDEANFGNRYKTFSARLLKATFNYQYARKDPGGYTHNGKFVIQLCHDSIEDLNVSAMTSKIDLGNAVRDDRGHFDGTARAFRYWDPAGEVAADCARCHSASRGYDEYLVYGTNTAQEIENGFDCAVCHTTFNTFDTRRILQVEFPSGKTTEQLPPTTPTDDPAMQSNMCIVCHQGRTSKKQIDEAIAGGDLSFQNVHYLAAAATLYGTEAEVGYEYDGKTYSGKFRHTSNSDRHNCVFCHSPNKTTHTFLPQDNIDTCYACHTFPNGLITDIRLTSNEDYDGDDLYPGSAAGTENLVDEVKDLARFLFAEIQAYATGTLGEDICYDDHAYPYFFKDTNGNGICDPDTTPPENIYPRTRSC
ncbi:MAG: cytochrome c3 family protein [Planctomycetota bacterium]|jgi:hypothetical protein